MTLPPHEPGSSAEIAGWVRDRTRDHDEFADVYDASEAHRVEHGGDCTVYPSSVGPLLGTLAAAMHPKRILEVGCGLGYSALWLARGSAPGVVVETIESDPAHAALARAQFDRHGLASRITVREGRAIDVLPKLTGQYGVIFSDGDPDEYAASLEHFIRLLTPGALLITSNLFLAQYAPDIPGLDQATEYRERILDDARLRTAFLASGLALSVRA